MIHSLILPMIHDSGPELVNFVKRNLLALVTPLTLDSLKFVKEDGRPNVVTILDKENTLESDEFIKKMKAAAKTHRTFVFTSVVASQWPKFVRPFRLGRKPVLPTVIIWDEKYYSKVSALTFSIKVLYSGHQVIWKGCEVFVCETPNLPPNTEYSCKCEM